MTEAPKVFILILNYNNYADTLECLESLLSLDYPNFQVVVCDNASTNDSLDRMRAWASGQEPFRAVTGGMARFSSPPVAKPIELAERSGKSTESSQAPIILISTGGNFGYAGGNNVGLQWVMAQTKDAYVWIQNNDIVVEPDSLSQLVARATTESAAGFVAPAVCDYGQPEIVQGYGGGFNPLFCKTWHIGQGDQYDPAAPPVEIESRMAYAYGASMLVTPRLLKEVGLMSEEYFLYHEEIDWALRAGRRYKLCAAPKARVYHKDSQTIGNGEVRTPLSEQCFTRGRIILTRKFFPWFLPLVYLSLIYTLIKKLVLGQPRNLAVIAKAMLFPNSPVKVN